MLHTLTEVRRFFEEADQGEVNTPVRLRSILRSVDVAHVLPYVHSFAMNILNQIFKSNNIYGERLCKQFVLSEFWKFNHLKQNGMSSFPDLQLFTKKCLAEYVGKRLESYKEEDEHYGDNERPLYSVHYKAIANKRNKQEDRYFGVSNVVNYACNHHCFNNKTCIRNNEGNDDRILFVGLFDGHNGPEAAEHCHHLAPHMVSNYIQTSLCYKGQYNVVEALGEAYHSLNNNLNGCQNKYRWKAGTTSTMCLIDHDFVYTGWVGDCSAWMIYKDDNQVPLTDILHRPSQASEVVDVWNNGGIVTKSGNEYDRVNGILGVTRALGDDRKIVGVSSLPSISEYKLTGHELCMVLASDGLWDSSNCSGLDVGSLCREYFLPSDNGTILPSTVDQLCQAIVDRAVKGGASDNVTVVVVLFIDVHSHILPSKSEHVQDYRAARWPRNRRKSTFVNETRCLRQCPEELNNYLQTHFSHNARMHSLLVETKNLVDSSPRRRRRVKSLSQEIQKRFSSPIRFIDASVIT